jgi:antirestriction protein ArdC
VLNLYRMRGEGTPSERETDLDAKHILQQHGRPNTVSRVLFIPARSGQREQGGEQGERDSEDGKAISRAVGAEGSPLNMANVYEIVTAEIVSQLEQGIVPWRKPWSSALPCNLLSQKPYRGMNVLMLATAGFESKYWLTLNQANKLGGKIKQGSKSHLVTFWNVGKERLNPKTGKETKPFLLRYYRVFNLCQTEGIELPRAVFERNKRNEFEAIEAAESLAESMPNPPAFEQSDAAWYSPKRDAIGLPARHAFHTPAEYYSTLFHELTHSTGHASRLHRESFDNPTQFGSESYSKEELIAEMGAAFLCGLSGIERETLSNSAAYLHNWITRLKGDSKLILSAASLAQKAADYISRNAIADQSETESQTQEREREAA